MAATNADFRPWAGRASLSLIAACAMKSAHDRQPQAGNHRDGPKPQPARAAAVQRRSTADNSRSRHRHDVPDWPASVPHRRAGPPNAGPRWCTARPSRWIRRRARADGRCRAHRPTAGRQRAPDCASAASVRVSGSRRAVYAMALHAGLIALKPDARRISVQRVGRPAASQASMPPSTLMALSPKPPQAMPLRPPLRQMTSRSDWSGSTSRLR